MTPEQLKASILQYAIQGKLVEQRTEEGTAEELYQKIQEEKQKLIKEGKIKKEKPLAEITEDEKPFDIPDSWKWVKLGDLVSVLGGKRIPAGRKLTKENTSYIYVRVSDMKNETVLTDDLQYVPEDIYPSISKYIINKEDVYITVAGTIGRIGKIPVEIDGANLTENADRLVFKMLDQDWLIKALSSYLIQNQIADATTKVGQPKLAIKRIQELLIPLPPLAEQHRIVAKIEELLPFVDRYAASYEKLEQFNAKFPEDMKKSILQYAIQGKLVEQRPEEGTAESEIKVADALKDKLNSDGILKGRKTKELHPIGSDIPFDLPDSWRWVRLGDLVEIFGRIGFRGYTKNDIVNKGEGAITMSPSNINQLTGAIDFSNSTYLSWEKYEESPEIMLAKGDIVLVKTGSSYGKCGIIQELPEKATINPQLAILKYISCDNNYLNWALKSPCAKSQYEQFVTGTSIPTFSQEKLANMFIPLPPLAEQHRIVAKIEELLPYCDQLIKQSKY